MKRYGSKKYFGGNFRRRRKTVVSVLGTRKITTANYSKRVSLIQIEQSSDR